MLSSRPAKKMRSVHKVVVVAAILAAFSGLLPSPAQAGFKCTSTNYHWCGDYVCCTQHCAWCYNTDTGEIYSYVCGDPDCFGMWV